MSGKLYVVGTPIGNLEDLTLRALRVLKEVSLIAAEDTRHTGLLLKHFEIDTPQASYHKFNEAKRLGEFIQRFANGESIALVSDAGMPGVSDPGERLIRECLEQGVAVEVIPGPSAVLHGLVASGLKITPFYFGGFLPVKGGARRKELIAAAARESTSIYFESPYRIMRTLEDCQAVIPDAVVCVARELTKKFEEVKRGRPEEVLHYYRSEGKAKGEITFLVQGANDKTAAKSRTEDSESDYQG